MCIILAIYILAGFELYIKNTKLELAGTVYFITNCLLHKKYCIK